MLTEVKKHIKLVFLCFKYNIIKSMDNKAAFFGQIFGMILNNSMFIVQWIVLFSLKDNIGGYGFNEVLLLWGLSATAYGISNTLFGAAGTLSSLISLGKLDAFLVQPKDTLISVISSKTSVSAIGDMIFGYIVLIFVKANIITWLLFTLFAITGAIIMTSIFILYNSFAFKFGNADDIANSFMGAFINVQTYPEGIFGDFAKWIFMTVIPVSWSVFLPIQVIKEGNYANILLIIAFALAISIIAYIVFNKGLKKYSSGNLMVSRI